ncbi:SLC13 family permease [Frateuria hangzhouensis]|uniref:SLC13 family permease n=1 Tax=Frateuria hangzhouensis TaxID=2995589 RepID=UPI002260C920|nr:SLC13 family permease [Frateuria sp. STR12]MCX7514492.1 SLC13 family permease [Frateuria sp. STR12]
MELQQILFLVILVGALVLLVTEWVRIDLTGVLIVVALAASGVLKPAEALSGFSSDPAILLAAMFVLSAGLAQTGLTARLGSWIGRMAGASVWRAVLVIMPCVALMAAFSHHLMVTAMMLPVILELNRSHNLPASRLMMPMAFAASLGTTVTVIAAPAFLVARDLLERGGAHDIGIFSIAPAGIVLSLIGTAYVLLFGRWLLPSRAGKAGIEDRFRLERYYTELVVLADSPHAGKTMQAFSEEHAGRFQVVDWLRHGDSRRRPWRRKQLGVGDLLLVRASPDELAELRNQQGLALSAVVQYGEEIKDDAREGREDDERLLQAVVAPDSELVGRTIGTVDFLRRYGVVVVGLWRKHGFIRKELSKIQLKGGDLVVLWGNRDALDQLAHEPSFLLLVPFSRSVRARRGRGWLAAMIMGLSVVGAASGLLPVTISFMAGAAAMVASGCLTLKQAYASMEIRIFVFIAGAIPLGLAMEQTGTATLFAGWLSGVVSGWSPTWVLLAMFLTAAVFTQILSDTATTILLGPIALGMAALLHLSAPAMVFSVAMGAVAAFLTPIGHHGNLLVYEPGNYRFVDFVRVGTPLTLILGLALAWLAPLIWPAE